jgi:transposase
VRKPRVIPDEGHEVVYERVAAVDVAKASGVVCMRLPDPARPGRYSNQIWDNVPAARARITELGRELLRHQVQMVTLESTSDYWRIWYYVLESIGLAVQLVSASQARNLKGRPKTDPLTDHLGVFSQLAGRVVMGVATVAGHERRRGWPTRSGPAGGAALRVA